MMEVNCIVFPAPREFQFGYTIRKIFLVPRGKSDSHSYYHSEYLDIEENTNNQFAEFLRVYHNREIHSFNENPVMETKEQEKSQCAKKEGETKTIQTTRSSRNKTAVKHLLQNYSSVVTQDSLPKISSDDYIPCLFLPGNNKKKIIVFFHANGEDLSSAFQFVSTVINELNVSILMMEYRGYSIFEGNPNPAQIIDDANRVLQFLFECKVKAKDVILMGRSIGGAVAFSMAAKYEVGSLVLLSPFLSLKKIAEDLYGTCSSALLKETFDNKNNAKSLRSPTLLVHGMKDQLVPYEHSLAILSQCGGYSRLHLIQNMTHSRFSFRKDFIQPLKVFLADLDILTI